MRMTSLQEKLQMALYIERYAQGHSKECPCAIPELRRNIFTKCICGKTLKDSLKRQEISLACTCPFDTTRYNNHLEDCPLWIKRIRLTEEAMEKINEG